MRTPLGRTKCYLGLGDSSSTDDSGLAERIRVLPPRICSSPTNLSRLDHETSRRSLPMVLLSYSEFTMSRADKLYDVENGYRATLSEETRLEFRQCDERIPLKLNRKNTGRICKYSVDFTLFWKRPSSHRRYVQIRAYIRSALIITYIYTFLERRLRISIQRTLPRQIENWRIFICAWGCRGAEKWHTFWVRFRTTKLLSNLIYGQTLLDGACLMLVHVS